MAQVFTIVGMNALGFPAARLVAEATQNQDGSVTFREPRARKRYVAPVGTRILPGDQVARVKRAVWLTTPDGQGKTTRYHCFAPEWARVMAEVCA